MSKIGKCRGNRKKFWRRKFIELLETFPDFKDRKTNKSVWDGSMEEVIHYYYGIGYEQNTNATITATVYYINDYYFSCDKKMIRYIIRKAQRICTATMRKIEAKKRFEEFKKQYRPNQTGQ